MNCNNHLCIYLDFMTKNSCSLETISINNYGMCDSYRQIQEGWELSSLRCRQLDRLHARENFFSED